MKYIIILLAFKSFSATAQQHTLKKMWETDSIIAIPESVLKIGQTLYISLIDGAPWDADGKGGVGMLSPDGSTYNDKWISGLNAPKGMGVFGNRLYVADINNVVVIDMRHGIVLKKIPVDSATGLNDISVTDEGVVFVSDSKLGNIWKIENDKALLYLNDMTGVNGLKNYKGNLYIGAGKSFVKATAQKQMTVIAEVPQPIDGIEPIGNGDFIVTSWSGYIYYVTAGGQVQTLLDTHNEKRNTADIGYDSDNRILYVPTFFAKTVAAYQLK